MLYNELENLCKTVEREIEEMNDKIRKSGGKLSSSDLEYVDKLTHTLKSIKTTMAMMDSGYSNYYDNRTEARRRDSMGRYTRDDGMIHELKDLMHRTSDDQMRNEISNLVSRLERM